MCWCVCLCVCQCYVGAYVHVCISVFVGVCLYVCNGVYYGVHNVYSNVFDDGVYVCVYSGVYVHVYNGVSAHVCNGVCVCGSDGSNQQVGGCLRDFRNKQLPVLVRIEYYKRTLTVCMLCSSLLFTSTWCLFFMQLNYSCAFLLKTLSEISVCSQFDDCIEFLCDVNELCKQPTKQATPSFANHRSR